MSERPKDGPRALRSLLVTAIAPWPELSGNRRRMSTVLRGLARAGTVDAFLLTGEAAPPPEGSAVSRVGWGPRPRIAPSVFERASWALGSPEVPSELLGLDDGATSAALATWIREQPGPYDLIWFNRPVSYLAASSAVSAPALLDLDDLEDRKVRARLNAGIDETGTWGGPELPGWRMLARYKSRRDAQGWRALQVRVARETKGVVLASDEGASDSGLDGPEIVPNCYPVVPATERVTSDAPTFLLVGLMTYRPNADGARWFVRDVWPTIRLALPGARLRIVGAASGSVMALDDEPGVSVAGELPALDRELEDADVAVVPIRYGGGTRLKVLEAWAHGIPVVSTSVGAAGLGARDGEHVLIADDAATFARACQRAAGDLDLRARVVEAGRRLHAERFTCDRVEATIADLARRASR